jgi:hypothetical protein
MPENLTNSPIHPTLPLSFEDVGNLRVRPAELARMLGVSRQSVSQWIQTGKVTLGADGRVDPAKATRQVIDNSDPGRLRARVLRSAVEDVGTLRRRIANLEHQLAAADARIAWADVYIDEEARGLDILGELLVARAAEFRDIDDVELLRAFIAQLMDDASLMAGGYDPAAPIEGDAISAPAQPLEGAGKPHERV